MIHDLTPPIYQDYSVLERMATCLPNSSFQKLGLAACSLQSALSTLTSTLTTLRTVGGSERRTARRDIERKEALGSAGAKHQAVEDIDLIRTSDLWNIYVDSKVGCVCVQRGGLARGPQGGLVCARV